MYFLRSPVYRCQHMRGPCCTMRDATYAIRHVTMWYVCSSMRDETCAMRCATTIQCDVMCALRYVITMRDATCAMRCGDTMWNAMCVMICAKIWHANCEQRRATHAASPCEADHELIHVDSSHEGEHKSMHANSPHEAEQNLMNDNGGTAICSTILAVREQKTWLRTDTM